MAKTLNSKKKLCMIKTNGPIAELGGITGPILYPCRIDMRKVINMVQHGIRVIEVNPKNQSETVQLTIQNVTKDNFPDPPKYTMTAETKKEEPKVVKPSDVVKAVQTNLVEEKKVDASEAKVNEAVKAILNSTDENTEKSEFVEADSMKEDRKKDWYKNKSNKSDFNKK